MIDKGQNQVYTRTKSGLVQSLNYYSKIYSLFLELEKDTE